MIAQHSSKSVEHYTPLEVVELARKVLISIDLDPASTALVNETRVLALEYIGLPNDGLEFPWHGRVFLNPPGGRAPVRWARHYGTPSNACVWWRKLAEEYKAGRTTEAIFVGFTLEILRTGQGRRPSPLEFPFCVPRERLCFGGDDPTHANTIIYLGDKPEVFEQVFSELGQVKR